LRVLVTGGAGYIGSHAVLALEDRGHEVVILDNLITGHRRFAAGHNFVKGDIGDLEKTRAVLQNVDAVMHFAAHAYVGESYANPRKYFENNIAKSIAFLGAAIDANLKYFVFSSTCSVYGVPSSTPITERMPKCPLNPYGQSKSMFEEVLKEYGRAHGLKHVSLRYFNAAGADSKLRVGELHDPETHLIPSALAVAAGLRKHLEIFGSDYPTPDGTCLRDYIHVSDLADAHVKALDLLASEAIQEPAVNLGTGVGYSVLDVIAAVERATGKRVTTLVRPRRPGDSPRLIADPTLAGRLLGWTAKWGLQEMVSTAWAWMQKEMSSAAPA